MAHYVDGFVLPVAKRKIEAYRRLSQKASKIWKEHGALDYRECVLDDPIADWPMPFPKGIKSKSGETVVFAWIMYKSRAHRDRVNAKVMKDPRLTDGMDEKNMPFDCKRMLYGGFKTIVEA
jgi:uncharacterized protein YbaA (DUF1428 family)